MEKLPNSNIRVLAPVEGLNYFDNQDVQLRRAISPLEAWNAIMAHPRPVLKIAFKLRDAISGLFGVKAITGFSNRRVHSVKCGDRLDFFLVEYTDENTLVLTERDTHLDVMTCVSTDGAKVSITSSVQVHNWFGHAYMIPVGIAHKWIVRGDLKRLRKTIAA